MSRNAIIPLGIGLCVFALAAWMPAPIHAVAPTPAVRQIWVVTTVGNAGRCFDEGASLALDDQDVPSISFLNFSQTPGQIGGLTYAHLGTDGWVTQVVDPGDAHGRHSSLALDSQQRPHISYRDGEAQELKYAFWDGSQWQVESVGLQGWNSALALDAQDRPHIAYLGSSQQPSYAVRADAGWKTEAIEPVFTSNGIALALDTNGQAHVTYKARTNLEYAVRDSTGWITETVHAGVSDIIYGTVGAYSTLALDEQDDPHLAYSRYYQPFMGDLQPGDLYYAIKPAATWLTQTVSPIGNTGIFASLVLDDQGMPHISYWDSIEPDKTLRYTAWDGATWVNHVVDGPVALEGPTSLKLDSAGRPHIAYCTGSEVRYARTVEVDFQSRLPLLTSHSVPEPPTEFWVTSRRCDPNEAMTWFQGTTYHYGQPVSGYRVALSDAPDGPIIQSAQSGAHPGYEGWGAGYYALILDPSGPREGDWYLWLMDLDGQRISQIAHMHTDGTAGVGTCQQAVIDFSAS